MTARDHTTPRSVADQTVPELGGRTDGPASWPASAPITNGSTG